MKTWFDLPLAVRVTVVVAMWFGYGLLVTDLNELDNRTGSAQVIWVGCLVGAVIAVAVDTAVHRKFGSGEALATFRAALRSGVLPAHPDLEVWQRWCASSRVFLAIAWLCATPTVLLGFASGLGARPAYHWVAVVAFPLIAVWGIVTSFRRHVRLIVLEVAVKKTKVQREQSASSLSPVEQRWHRALQQPLPMRLFASAASIFTYALVILLVVDAETLIFGDSGMTHLGWAALIAAAMGLTEVFVDLRDPRSRTGVDAVQQLAAYDAALRTGELPAHIEPQLWRRWLSSDRRVCQSVILWACFLLAVGVSSVATHHSVYRWVVATILELVAILLIIGWWGKRAVATQLAMHVERYAVRQSWG